MIMVANRKKKPPYSMHITYEKKKKRVSGQGTDTIWSEKKLQSTKYKDHNFMSNCHVRNDMSFKNVISMFSIAEKSQSLVEIE
jgi:hypothetical protein